MRRMNRWMTGPAAVVLGGAAAYVWASACPYLLADFERAMRNGWSVRCEGTDLQEVTSSDDQRECLQEVFDVGAYRLEHKWRFSNVPEGQLYLTFEGYRSGSSNDDFEFWYKIQSAGFGTAEDDGFQPVPNAVINACGEMAFTVPITTLGQTDTVYIAVLDTRRQHSDDVSDKVYIDFLRVLSF